MGMALIGARYNHYNWSGWRWLITHLESWGVDVREFRFSNDGDFISPETCMAVADAIEAHLTELDDKDREWIEPHIDAWRHCGGCSQL